MQTVGNGLEAVGLYEDWLRILEAQLATARRLGASEVEILRIRFNTSMCYTRLGRHQEALDLDRELYARSVALKLTGDLAFRYALSLSKSLLDTRRFTEAKSLLREQYPKARQALGAEAEVVLNLRWNYAAALYAADGPRDDVIEAVAILEELLTTARRIYGTHHHFPGFMQKDLEAARSKLSFLARHAVGATPKDN